MKYLGWFILSILVLVPLILWNSIRPALEVVFHKSGASELLEAHLELQGLMYSTEEELFRATGLGETLSVFRSDFWEIQRRLLQAPWIESAEVHCSKSLPVRCSATVSEASPWIVADYNQQTWLVSTSGKLIQTLDLFSNPQLIMKVSDLPRLSGLQAPSATVPSVLSSENARLQYAIGQLRLLQAAGGVPFSVERYDLLPEGHLVLRPLEAEKFPEVMLNVHTNAEATLQLGRLRQVLADLSLRGEIARGLDLRFENQVVVR